MDNREIIDYDILKAETVEELATLTNKAIRDGWRPVGGAFVGTPFFRENERVTDNPLEIVGGHTINTFCQTIFMHFDGNKAIGASCDRFGAVKWETT